MIQTETSILLYKKKYANTLLKHFGLRDCKSVATSLSLNEKQTEVDGSEMANEYLYRKIVRSLLYLTTTRPYIMFTASLLARFRHNPTKKHMGIAKMMLRYTQGTLKYEITYKKGKEAMIIGYYGNDWVRSEDDMKNSYGYAFSLGSGVFSWASIKSSLKCSVFLVKYCVCVPPAQFSFILHYLVMGYCYWD